MLHEQSPRRDHPFVVADCTNLPATLIDSLLFGHEKGAFTGADRAQVGRIREAGKGILFLDEIGELPPEVQGKLLRLLENGTYRPLGGDEQKCEARIVAATHVNLEARVAQRAFREDLYYRIKVATLDVPALAERRAELPALIAELAAPHKIMFTDNALEYLVQRRWPGNVRELKNAIECIALFSEADLITREMVIALIDEPPGSELDVLVRSVLDQYDGNKLALVENKLFEQAIATSCTKAEAARKLGVERKVVDRWVDKSNNHRPLDEPTEVPGLVKAKGKKRVEQPVLDVRAGNGLANEHGASQK
jgi:DNA-binding NtrC family response regulator